MGKLILVRHGESEANRDRCFSVSDDVPLTDRGREQAWDLARSINARFKPAHLLTSEFLRARQTAEIIGRELGLRVEPLPGIHERDFGCLKGCAYERMGELMAGDRNYDPQAEWLWAPDGGESREDVRKRVIPALEGLQVRFSEVEVIVVCHGAVMASVWAHLTGNWEAPNEPVNCGILVTEWDSQGLRLFAESEASA